MPKSKKRGEKYFNDEVLLSLMDGQLEGSASLRAEFKGSNLDAVLKRLDELGVTVKSTKEDLQGKPASTDTGRRYDEDIEGIEAVKDHILSEFTSSSKGDAKGRRIPIGTLTKAGKEYLEKISGLTMKPNVSFILNASDLRHIYNEHYGVNEKDTGNNIPLTDEDIRSLVDVVTSPDHIIFGTDVKDGRKVFYFLKDSGDGAYNLAEVYSDKHGNLTAKTFYKTKKGSSLRADELLNSSTLSTSETSGASLSSVAKIPKIFETSKINTDFNTSEDRRYDEGNTELQPYTERRNRIAKHVESLLKRLGTKANTTVYHCFDELPERDKQYIRERECPNRHSPFLIVILRHKSLVHTLLFNKMVTQFFTLIFRNTP